MLTHQQFKMKKIIIPIASAILLASCGEQTGQQDKSAGHVWLPSVFADGMVLQQKSDAPIWGKSAPGAQVSVQGSWGQSATATADDKGIWRTSISTPQFGGPYTVQVISGDTAKINDVLIGEVWVASGQSNMEMPMEGWAGAFRIRTLSKAVPDYTVLLIVLETSHAERSWKLFDLLRPDIACLFEDSAGQPVVRFPVQVEYPAKQIKTAHKAVVNILLDIFDRRLVRNNSIPGKDADRDL